jgi:hypothetical protein
MMLEVFCCLTESTFSRGWHYVLSRSSSLRVGEKELKLEEQILVTETGVERISSYPFRLDWL